MENALCSHPHVFTGRVKQLLRIMRISTFLLLATCLQVSARGYSQRITLSEAEVPLSRVFRDIRQRTGFTFLYTTEMLKNAGVVSFRLRDATLEEVLTACFRDQPFTWEIDGNTVIVKPKPAVSPMGPEAPPGNEIRGRVTDEQGRPLEGASVMVRGERQGTQTDADGRFDLRNVPPDAVLEIGYTGYVRYEVKAEAGKELTVSLKLGENKLDETQVIGYGTTSRRLNTGSVSTVKAEEIQNEPLTNPLQAIEGMVPGLYIQQGSGMPGGISKVSLRGTNSITSGTNPLYIIDGVPFDGNQVDKGGSIYIGAQPNGGNDPLNSINPNDIATIDVLKDADATSIYGSRGANGVIIITTKRAKGGKTNLDGKVYTGESKSTHLIPTLNTTQYLNIRKQAFANDGITPSAANAPDLVTWSPTQNTNYEKMLIGNTSHVTDANLSLSGGNGVNGFLLSGAFHDESSVILGNYGYKRGALHMKANHTSADGKLKADFTALYSDDNNQMPTADITSTVISYPNNFPLYNPGGTLYFGGGFNYNPLSIMRLVYKTETSNLLLDAVISYAILPNLQVKVNLGDNVITLNQKQLFPASASNPATVSSSSGEGQYTSNTTKTYLVEPQIDYHTLISKGKLSAVAGATYQYKDYNEPFYVLASGFASDALIGDYGSAGSIIINKDYEYEYLYASVFGRVNYNWQDKYLLNATFRRDGSSRFGPGKQFANFGSVGAAWLFTEEDFLKDQHWLSFGKLRSSYGTVGNDQISNFTYLDSYASTFAPYGSVAGTIPSRIANPDFRWETTKKLEVGLELGFLNNNLLFNASWYRNRSDDLLVSAPLTGQTGFTSYTANLPAMVQNKGWEFEVKGTPVSSKAFNWSVSFNISTSQNKLLAFPNLANSNYANSYVIGQPLGIYTAYHLTGFSNGVAQVQDVNKDGVISAGLNANGKGDYIIAGQTAPKYYGGFTNNLRYKSFQLDLFFNFVNQLGYSLTTFPGLLGNQYYYVLNSPFKASTEASSASYSSYINYYLNSDARIKDASFIRLRNAALSYNLNPTWLKSIRASDFRIYLSAQNMLTFTHYKCFDPETGVIPPGIPIHGLFFTTAVLPPLKTITAGLQFSF